MTLQTNYGKQQQKNPAISNQSNHLTEQKGDLSLHLLRPNWSRTYGLEEVPCLILKGENHACVFGNWLTLYLKSGLYQETNHYIFLIKATGVAVTNRSSQQPIIQTVIHTQFFSILLTVQIMVLL